MKIQLTDKDKEIIKRVWIPLLEAHLEAFKEVRKHIRLSRKKKDI